MHNSIKNVNVKSACAILMVLKVRDTMLFVNKYKKQGYGMWITGCLDPSK